jgi:hypothetical protein
MSEPRRLLDEGSDLERAVLGSARGDAPPPDLDERVRASLHLGPAGGGVGAAKAAKAAGALAAAKWVGVALVGGAMATTSVVAVTRRPAQSVTPAPASASAQVVAAPPIAPPASAPPIAPPSVAPPSVAPPSVAPPSTAARAPGPAPSRAPSAPAARDLDAEIASLDAARAALDVGDTGGALALLDRHDLEFPRGQLAPESLALRIQAYDQRHDSAQVLRLCDAFLAAYPFHPQARRIHAIADSSRANNQP